MTAGGLKIPVLFGLCDISCRSTRRKRGSARRRGPEAKTVPVYFAGLQGNIAGVPWPQIAAGMMIFVTPIVVFTVLVRRHLLRGVTFGTIKQ